MKKSNPMMRLFVLCMTVSAAYVPDPLRAEDVAADWNFKTAKANDAVRKYQAARKKLDEAWEKNRAENRASLVAKLQEQVKAATKKNDLDGALALRDAIKTLQADTSAEKLPADSPKERRVPAKAGNAHKAKKDETDEPQAVYLVSFNFPERMIGDDMTLTTVKENSAFFIRKGLSGTGTVSLESVRKPGWYLAVPTGLDARIPNPLTLEKVADDANQKRRATFKMRPGAANKTWHSFETSTKSGFFIRHAHFRFLVTPLSPTVEDLQSATFKVTNASDE